MIVSEIRIYSAEPRPPDLYASTTFEYSSANDLVHYFRKFIKPIFTNYPLSSHNSPGGKSLSRTRCVLKQHLISHAIKSYAMGTGNISGTRSRDAKITVKVPGNNVF